jgi:hypothetical protein
MKLNFALLTVLPLLAAVQAAPAPPDDGYVGLAARELPPGPADFSAAVITASALRCRTCAGVSAKCKARMQYAKTTEIHLKCKKRLGYVLISPSPCQLERKRKE